MRIHCVFPPRREALTRNAPSVRIWSRVTSFHVTGTPGKTRIVLPQLCSSMSWSDRAADSGVSITGPASVYIVFGKHAYRPVAVRNVSKNLSASSGRPIEDAIDDAPVHE